MLKQSAFRDRDICALAESELTDDDVVLLGKALATYLIRYSGRIICVGRDARDSSPRIHAALLKGLQSVGATVVNIGVVPAPVLYQSVFGLSTDAGIMITAGDQGAKYNGFKLMCGTSLLTGRALEDIYKAMSAGDFETGEGQVKETDASEPYIEQIVSQFQLRRGLKIHVEAASETAQPVLKELLKRLKVTAAKRGEADLEVKLSAGTDRLKVSDEKGRTISAESLLLLLSREILSRKPGSIVLYDDRFPEFISRTIIELSGTPVAMSASELSIQSRLKQERAELSVLASGEIVFADRYYGFEDAIYATCRLIEIAALADNPISLEVKKLVEGRIAVD